MNKPLLCLFVFAATSAWAQEMTNTEAKEVNSGKTPQDLKANGAPDETASPEPDNRDSERTERIDFFYEDELAPRIGMRERLESSLGSKLPDLTVGVRFLTVNLLSDRKGRPFEDSFIGSIYKLEAEQDFFALRPYVQITERFGPVIVGAGFGYDSMEVATMDQGDGDGDIEIDNWMLYLVAAWPNPSRFTPFGEIGQASYNVSFKPHAYWYEEGKRNFKLDDSSSIYLAGGCDVAVSENFSLSGYLRYTDIDIDGVYVYRGDDRLPADFTFTLENLTYGLGASYRF